jgi:hypothetical protein
MQTKWWHFRVLKPTRQHTYGMISGLGLGLFSAWSYPAGPGLSCWGRIVGAFLIAIGGHMAFRDQEKRESASV